MAATQTCAGTVKIQTALNYINTLDDTSTITDAYARSVIETYTSGASGALKVNLMFHNRYVIDGGPGTQELDLVGGLTNAFGTFTFTKIMALMIQNVTTTAGHTLSVGGGTHPVTTLTAAGGDLVKIGAGGMFLMTAPQEGFAVGADGVADDIKIINDHATVASTVDIMIIGVGTIA